MFDSSNEKLVETSACDSVWFCHLSHDLTTTHSPLSHAAAI